jgi:hypothetical protein
MTPAWSGRTAVGSAEGPARRGRPDSPAWSRRRRHRSVPASATPPCTQFTGATGMPELKGRQTTPPRGPRSGWCGSPWAGAVSTEHRHGGDRALRGLGHGPDRKLALIGRSWTTPCAGPGPGGPAPPGLSRDGPHPQSRGVGHHRSAVVVGSVRGATAYGVRDLTHLQPRSPSSTTRRDDVAAYLDPAFGRSRSEARWRTTPPWPGTCSPSAISSTPLGTVARPRLRGPGLVLWRPLRRCLLPATSCPVRRLIRAEVTWVPPISTASTSSSAPGAAPPVNARTPSPRVRSRVPMLSGCRGPRRQGPPRSRRRRGAGGHRCWW